MHRHEALVHILLVAADMTLMYHRPRHLSLIMVISTGLSGGILVAVVAPKSWSPIVSASMRVGRCT